ncbi:hypothetical protein ZHAS_00002018 [Anopheles sinensis]|uniref:Uncharacterized protein n=1 Tax=Anopheles sinensis TaxID=74873 RepID=A0A084VBP8_ANOSI|nr:hypothetical protein ZHAS_00002018 [Anopheles sinensis]
MLIEQFFWRQHIVTKGFANESLPMVPTMMANLFSFCSVPHATQTRFHSRHHRRKRCHYRCQYFHLFLVFRSPSAPSSPPEVQMYALEQIRPAPAGQAGPAASPAGGVIPSVAPTTTLGLGARLPPSAQHRPENAACPGVPIPRTQPQ